jgi:hypothetical protein
MLHLLTAACGTEPKSTDVGCDVGYWTAKRA